MEEIFFCIYVDGVLGVLMLIGFTGWVGKLGEGNCEAEREVCGFGWESKKKKWVKRLFKKKIEKE